MGISSLSQALNATPPGLALVTTSTFSAVSSVSVNGCFTSAYANYRIMLEFTPSTGSQEVLIRLRVSSSDATTNYDYTILNAQNTTVAGAGLAATSAIRISATNGTSSRHSTYIDVFDPATAVHTACTYLSGRPSSGNIPLIEFGVGYHATATAYDGFTVYPSAGTITGQLSVYGYEEG